MGRQLATVEGLSHSGVGRSTPGLKREATAAKIMTMGILAPQGQDVRGALGTAILPKFALDPTLEHHEADALPIPVGVAFQAKPRD